MGSNICCDYSYADNKEHKVFSWKKKKVIEEDIKIPELEESIQKVLEKESIF